MLRVTSSSGWEVVGRDERERRDTDMLAGALERTQRERRSMQRAVSSQGLSLGRSGDCESPFTPARRPAPRKYSDDACDPLTWPCRGAYATRHRAAASPPKRRGPSALGSQPTPPEAVSDLKGSTIYGAHELAPG